jgi:hypothetical protein
VRSSRPAALALLLFATLAPARVGATNPDAQSFFAQGRKLRQDGDCERAIVAFRHALETAPEGLGALRNIAECEEQLGRYASARNDWWALRRAVLQSNDTKYEGWDRESEAAHRRLEPRVGKLTVRLVGDELDRVNVTIDGQPLDPRLIGVELERDLGPHTIVATYGGAEPVTEKRALTPGTREQVTLTIPARKPGERAGPAKAPPPPPPSDGHGLRNGGFVAIGVGGLAGIGAGIAAAIRAGALSSITKACPGYATGQVCPSTVRGDRDAGRTASTLVNVFTGIAAVGVATGVTLVAVGVSSGGAPAPGPQAKLGVAPAAGGATAWATFTF